MKRNYSNLKYVILGENNFPRFSCVKRSFNRASRRRHVYKMHRHAVEHNDGRLFITHELRKRSLSYSAWYIDVYLCYMRDGEKMLLRAAVDVSTRIQDAAATSVSVPGRHRSSISYDVQINAIYRHPTIISTTNRERYFRLKKKAFVLIKRQRFVKRDAVVTCR